MKYVIVLGDGMADWPMEELGNITPLEYAMTPMSDKLSKQSEIGLVNTIPEGMNPGSDTANLSVLGYDPEIYYSGRSPLEALSIGIQMKESDVALRCNFVTLTEEEPVFEEKAIIDHSASEISTEDCEILLEAIKAELESELYKFYLGTSYRHCVIWDKGQIVELTPPHDILTKVIGSYLPKEDLLCNMMKTSYDVLVNHPINQDRKQRGLNPANCCWFWGAGTKPLLTSFEEKTGKKGMIISAVDLLKGIGVGAKMGIATVEGANGGLHTNYVGKTKAAVKALTEDNYDFVYIHIEAPDEMGHQGKVWDKVKAIEYLDELVITTLVQALDKKKIEFRMLILPDHPTPVKIRTHTSDSVPYLLYDSTKTQKQSWYYNEREASNSGNYFEKGYTLIDYLFNQFKTDKE